MATFSASVGGGGDALDEARDKTLQGKRATLEAMANHGSQGVADLAAQQQLIQSSHDAALNTLTSQAVGRGAPAAALGQLQSVAGGPQAIAAQTMGAAGGAYAADAARLQAAHGDYMDEAAAAVPVIRADADRRIGILREQWEQRKKLQEEQDAKDQGFLNLPEYLRDAYVSAALAAGPDTTSQEAEMTAIDKQITAADEKIMAEGPPKDQAPSRSGRPYAEGYVGGQAPIADKTAPARAVAHTPELDMLQARRGQVNAERANTRHAWSPDNPDTLAQVYASLGVDDPVLAAGLAQQYVQKNTPTASEQAASDTAMRNQIAVGSGFSSYADMVGHGFALNDQGQVVPAADHSKPIDPLNPPNRTLTADEAGQALGYDRKTIDSIKASDYYDDIYSTLSEMLSAWKETNNTDKPTWQNFLDTQQVDVPKDPKDPSKGTQAMTLDEVLKQKYGDEKGLDHFARTVGLVQEQLGNQFGLR